MIFEQAYFGGVRTHSCIASSLTDEILLSELTGQTDKPHTLDKIEPYFSGTRINGYYIFIKTIPVENAERTGIVFSHCIIAKDEQLQKINNLKPLFLRLLTNPELNKSQLDAIQINDEDLHIEEEKDSNRLVNKTLEVLLNNKKPVLIGYEVFTSVIFELWNVLPSFLRKNFTFRLSGNENDLSENPPSLIYTPLSNEIRWQNTKFVTISSNSEHVDLSPAENHLIKNIKNEFSSFIKKYEIEVQHLSDYRKIEKCYDYFNSWCKQEDIQELNKTIRVVANVFPKPNSVTKLKNELLNSFCNQIENASSWTILSIRNIDFNAYENGFKRISSTMDVWLNSLNENHKKHPISEIAELLNAYVEQTNPDWWNENIEGLIKSTGLLIDFHWQLWEYNPSFLHLSERFIVLNESDIIAKINETSNKSLIKEFINYTANKKWLNTHAICSAKYFKTTKEAIENHLLIVDNNYESFEHVVDVIGKSNFFNYAISTHNVELHKIAASKAVIDCTLLNSNNISNLNWQSIWYITLQETQDISYGIENVQELIFSFWDLVVSGQEFKVELAAFIAETEYGNVLEYPQRTMLWKADISDNIKTKILNITSISVVKMVTKFNLDDFEDELKRTLTSKAFVENTIGKQEISIKAQTIFLQNINALNEEYFIKLLLPNIKLVNSEEAIFIGEIINKYEWKRAVKLIRYHKNNNYNLNRAWNICKHHIGFWDNLFSSSSDKYEINENVNIVTMDKKIKIFISYSSADRNLREIMYQRLSIYLKSTKNRFDPIWTDKEIPLGGNWDGVIQEALETSDIGILLVSPMFLGSDYSMGEELEVMLKKKQEEGYLIFPILLRECNFHNNGTLNSIQFFKTYKSEYEVTDLLEKNKLMPFDELAEVENPKERLLNKYFQKLANEIDRAILI